MKYIQALKALDGDATFLLIFTFLGLFTLVLAIAISEFTIAGLCFAVALIGIPGRYAYKQYLYELKQFGESK